MWLRRLGVPPLWPSRAKVLCLGLLASFFILSIYQYLAGASAEYLRLTTPTTLDILCLLPIEECRDDPAPAECVVQVDSQKWLSDVQFSTACPMTMANIHGQTCLNVSLPLNTLQGNLGSLHSPDGGMNPFKLWSVVFVVLMSLLTLSILTHDLALLDDTVHQRIFTLAEVCDQTNLIRRYILCLRCKKRTGSRWRLYSGMFYPCWILLQSAAFMAVVYPFSFACFLCRPVRMSRMMVFLSSILCSLWSVVFVVLAASIYRNNVYTLLWSYLTPEGIPNCVCLCKYPLRVDVSLRMVCMGLGVLAHSSSLALRALKGLRRAQWANLFSVMYTVPIAAFPVVWHRPAEVGGGPIGHREPGEPVQGEPAFDPFCLMDEQPESACTRVHIAPVPRPERLEKHRQSLADDVGCCGFPHFLPSSRRPDSKWPLLRS